MMTRAARVMLGCAAAAILLEFLGVFVSGPVVWGFHHYAFLPRAFGLFLGLLMLALLIPGVSGAVARLLNPLAAGLERRGSARVVAAATIAVALVLFALGRQRAFFLSDGALLVRSVHQGIITFTADTLSAVIQLWFNYGLREYLNIQSQTTSFRIVSMGCGLIWLAAMFATVGRLTPSGWGRLLLGGLLATAGMTRLFYGYVETSPLLAAAVAVYVWAAVRWLQDGRGIVPATVAFLAAAGMHVTGLLLVPSYVYLAWRWAGGRRERLGIAALLLLLPAVAYMALWFSRGGTVKGVASAYAPYFSEFIPLLGPLNAKQSFTFFSLPHLVDFLNEQFLVGPFALLALAALLAAGAGWSGRPRREAAPESAGPQASGHEAAGAPAAPGRRARTTGGVRSFLLAVLVPFLLLSLVFNRKLGGPRDWDLVVTLALPAILLVGLRLLDDLPAEAASGADRGRRKRAAALPAGVVVTLLAASAYHLAGWVLVDTTDSRSMSHFLSLISDKATLSPFARSYALEELGTHYLDQGNPDMALPLFEQSARADPSNVKAAGTLGSMYTALGRLDEALKYHQEAVRLRPGMAVNHYNLASTLGNLGRWPDAARSFAEAVRLNPAFEQAYVGLSSALLRSDNAAGCDSVARSALGKFPQDVDLRTNLGAAEEALGRPDSAMAIYQEALRIDSRSPGALYNLGRMLLNAGRFKEALPPLESLAQLVPTDAETQVNLGVVYMQLNRLDDAARAFGRGITLDPKLAQAYVNLATVLVAQKKYDQALQILQSYVSEDSALAARVGITDLLRQVQALKASPGAP